MCESNQSCSHFVHSPAASRTMELSARRIAGTALGIGVRHVVPETGGRNRVASAPLILRVATDFPPAPGARCRCEAKATEPFSTPHLRSRSRHGTR
eukprot:5774865-Pyramimonas_sp.AAC.1